MNSMPDIENIEIEAPTVEQAIKMAMETYNVQKKDMDIVLLREETKGLFGMNGSDLAKIRVTVKQAQDASKTRI